MRLEATQLEIFSCSGGQYDLEKIRYLITFVPVDIICSNFQDNLEDLPTTVWHSSGLKRASGLASRGEVTMASIQGHVTDGSDSDWLLESTCVISKVGQVAES